MYRRALSLVLATLMIAGLPLRALEAGPVLSARVRVLGAEPGAAAKLMARLAEAGLGVRLDGNELTLSAATPAALAQAVERVIGLAHEAGMPVQQPGAEKAPEQWQTVPVRPAEPVASAARPIPAALTVEYVVPQFFTQSSRFVYTCPQLSADAQADLVAHPLRGPPAC